MGYIAHKDIYYNKHVFTSKGSNDAIYKQQMENKSNTTDYNYEQCTGTVTYTVLLGRTRHHSMHTKITGRPPHRQGGRRGP